MTSEQIGSQANEPSLEDLMPMIPALRFLPADFSGIEPEAELRYRRFLQGLLSEKTAQELTDNDFREEDKSKLKEYAGKISESLSKGQSPATYDMDEYKETLKAVCARKVVKERRIAALNEIDPPLDDAKKYLSDHEYQQFCDSVPGAIDSFLATSETDRKVVPGVWLLNTKAFGYHDWTRVIQARKREKARQKQAQLEYDRHLDSLSLAVEKVKVHLAQSKKPKFDYPAELDKYHPDWWCDLGLPTKEEVQNWAKRKILEWLPEIMANITRWELSWKVWVLPRAAYESADAPCLRWHFDGHVLVTAELELKTGVIRKHRPEGYSVDVQAAGEKLGSIFFGPREWLILGSFTTPVALLRLLAKGELEGPGISVTQCWPPYMTFAIQGFDEEVEVCDDFVRFIRDISKEKPLLQALVDRGLIDADTAKLAESKWDQPLPAGGSPCGSSPDLKGAVAKLMD